MRVGRLIREPLLHFFALGVALFLLYGSLERDGFVAPDEIVVGADRIAALKQQFERVWQRPPTEQELTGLVDNWICEEILYREGLALGFDRDDPVLRRRIGQKVAFMSDALVSEEVNDEELRTWLADNADQYRIDPEYSFRQVYFDPARHGDGLAYAIAEAREKLATGDAVGESTLLPEAIHDASASDVRRSFGSGFAEALADAPVDEWYGPVPSGYGVHLVRVEDVKPGRIPSLDEVRAAVERDVLADRTREASEALYRALRERYTVTYVDDVALATSGSSGTGSR